MPMTLISRTTLTTTAASVTFNSIPQTFQTLKLVVSSRSTSSSFIYDSIYTAFNTSTANHSWRGLYTIDGASAASSNSSSSPGAGQISGSANGAGTTASTFGNVEMTIPNYTGSANKAFSVDGVIENNATAVEMGLHARLWSNTSAITSIGLTLVSTGSFVSGSTFSLYGVS